jgi:oxalate decarboxylase
MLSASRRLFMKAFTFGATSVAATRACAAKGDGHAAGYEVESASEFMPTVPRKTGDPVVFTTSLDKAKIKATSGGATEKMR